jgi:Ca-activated chloride channel family protein
MPRSRTSALIIVVLGLALGTTVLSAGGQFTYKTGIEVVSFTVTVLDRAGAPVGELKAVDFEVKEDGAVQDVTYFASGETVENVPLHIGLLFDTSASMERDMDLTRGAAVRFLKTFSKAVDFTLVDFDTEVRAARFSQSEFPRLVERLRNRQAKGRTALYDALSVYLGSAFDQTGRKVLVLYTDGGDTSSSRTWPETLRALRASDVTIYPMGFMTQAGAGRLNQQNQLIEMAKVTGGQALFPSAMKDLDAMYRKIAAEVQAQYVLGYVSTNTARNGEWRKVEIRVKSPQSQRIQVRTRQGYFAPAR